MLSMHAEEQYAMRAIKAGASGYLTKDSASDQLVKAIKQIYKGRKYISQEVAELLVTDKVLLLCDICVVQKLLYQNIVTFGHVFVYINII